MVICLYTTGSCVDSAKQIQWNQVEIDGEKVYVRVEGVQVKNKEPLLLRLTTELGEMRKKLDRNGLVFDMFDTTNCP